MTSYSRAKCNEDKISKTHTKSASGFKAAGQDLGYTQDTMCSGALESHMQKDR